MTSPPSPPAGVLAEGGVNNSDGSWRGFSPWITLERDSGEESE